MSSVKYDGISFCDLHNGKHSSQLHGMLHYYKFTKLVCPVPKGKYLKTKVKGNYDIINLYISDHKPNAKTYQLYKDGKKLPLITNMARYCRKKDLCPSRMGSVIRGRGSYKGYTVVKEKYERVLINLNNETGDDQFSVEFFEDCGNWIDSFDSLEKAESFIRSHEYYIYNRSFDFRDTRSVKC